MSIEIFYEAWRGDIKTEPNALPDASKAKDEGFIKLALNNSTLEIEHDCLNNVSFVLIEDQYI